MEIILASCLEEDILPVFIRGSERGGKLGIDATQWLSKGKSLSMVVSRWRVFALKTFPSRPFLLAFLFPLSPFQERSLPFPFPSLPLFSFVPPFFLFPPLLRIDLETTDEGPRSTLFSTFSSSLSSLYLPLVLLRRESHEPRQAQRQWVRVKEEERAGCSSQTPRYRRRRTRFHGLNGRQHWFLARREEEPTSVLSTVVSRSRAGNFLPVSWLFAPFLPPFLSISISPRHNGRDSVIVHFLRVCNDRQIWPVDH